MSKTKNNKSTYKFTAGSQMKILEELNQNTGRDSKKANLEYLTYFR